MRVLLTHKPGGAYGYISESWLNTLRSAKINAMRWNGSPESWHAYDPDLYIGCSGHRQPIPKSRTKIAIHVNPCGQKDLGQINESNESIKWTISQNPNVVFGYGFEKDRDYWSYWESKYGIKWVPMANAADITLFNKKYENNKKYDIVYVGGKWAYKSKSIDAYLLPLLTGGTLTYKLYGWGEWSHNHCSGGITDNDVPNFLSSGSVGPCISEPHTHQYGIDVPERVFKIIMSGTVAVHDNTQSLADQIPSLLIARNPAEFSDMCHYWANMPPDHIQKKSDEQRKDVLSAHTYAHRLANLFNALGFTDEAKALLDTVPIVQ
jgi:hypothetical protein